MTEKVLVTESYLEDIADAIRAKTGGSDTYKPGEMAEAIRGIEDSGAVRYDEAQTLTDAQKQQARDNIGAGTGGGTGAVRYDEAQSLTDAQKTTARGNIAAASAGDVQDIEDEIGSTALPTTAQTITGAIAEHEGDIAALGNAGNVRYDEAQSLTAAEKQQARDNIGALSIGAGVVKYDVYQTLSDNNKNIARGNIGAASEDQVDAKADKTTTVNGHPLSANVTVTKGDVGLGNVDNTSDMSKPVSIAQQAALDDKVNVSDIANNLTTTEAGKALDARQGKVLADDVDALSAAMTYVVSGNKSIEMVAIPVGAYVRLVGSTIAGRSDGIYTVATAIPVDTVIDGTHFNESAPIPGGGLNALNASLGSYELLYSGGNTNSATVPSLSKYKWLLLAATWNHVIGVSTLIPRGVYETTIQSWYVNHIDDNGYRLARLTYINDTTIKITGITASGWICELYGIK